MFPSSATLSAQVLGPDDLVLAGAAAKVQWASQAPEVAEIEPDGRVRAIATGSTWLVSTSVVKPSVEATVSVTVMDAGRANVVVR